MSERRSVTLQQVWACGVASVRLPQGVRTVIGQLLGDASSAELAVALECDDVETLKNVALASDTVLAAPHRAVEEEVAAGSLRPLAVSGLPALYSDMGVVTLRGRTPSPMADLIIRRLPAAGSKTKRVALA